MTFNPFDLESNAPKEKLHTFSHHMGWPMIKDKGNHDFGGMVCLLFGCRVFSAP